MNKMPMCRICLVENVRMTIVCDKNLQELYRRLTDIPFVTEDRRPTLACFLCFAKLKQCCQLQKKCLEAEELFAQMMNEPNLSVNRGQLKYSSGLIVTPVENISIVDVSHNESITIKEELPAVCEGLDDVIEPKKEHLKYELELELLNKSYLDAEDVPARHSEFDSEYDVPLIEIKVEEVEEEQEVSRQKRRASDTTHLALTGLSTTETAVVKKPKLYKRGKRIEDVNTENQKKKKESDTKVIQNTLNCTSKLISKFEETLTNTTPRVNVIDISQSCFTRKDVLTRNIRTHPGEKPYKCKECQLCFSKKHNLTSHIRTHTGDKPYQCEVCRLYFSHKITLTRHIRTHTGEKPYKCEECQLCFTQKKSLIRHNRTHTGEKPYKCDICLQSFIQNCDLTRHFRIHTGAKPYKCEECQLCFSQNSHLTKHIRTHTGEKPYKCEECQLCFSHKSHLTTHIRTHTGEKPYKCEECQLCFSRKSTLTKHIHRRHAGKNHASEIHC